MNVLKYLGFGIILVSTFIVSANAQELRSPQYRIESGSFKLQPDLEQSTSNHDLSVSFGPDLKKNFENNGYVAIGRKNEDAAGEPYIRMKLSNSQLVFDGAEVADESVQKSSLMLFGRSVSPFTVAIRQESQFKNNFGAIIQSTLCDNDSSPCSPLLAKAWKHASGFGYRADGMVTTDFKDSQNYRPLFLDGGKNRSAVVFYGDVDVVGSSVDFQFKLRPEQHTQTGLYKSTVIIMAAAEY